MRKAVTTILVSLIMVLALLGITNPGHKQYRLFDYAEGRLVHDYFIYSIYWQSSYTLTADSTYRVYKRYIGIATKFYEISPVKVKQEE